MSFQSSQSIYSASGGATSTTLFVDFFSDRDPTPQDINFYSGKVWNNTITLGVFKLVSFYSTAQGVFANWVPLGGPTEATETITGDAGGSVEPISGNIFIQGNTGTLGGISFTNAGSSILNAQVRVDGSTIAINGSNQLYALPDVETYTRVVRGQSPYTVLVSDQFISVDSSAGPVSIILPNTMTKGRSISIKDGTGSSIANPITISSGVTIDGSLSFTINIAYLSRNFIFNSLTYETY